MSINIFSFLLISWNDLAIMSEVGSINSTTEITVDDELKLKDNHANISIGILGSQNNNETFIIPKTHDMIATLFNPKISKSPIDKLIILILSSYILLFLTINYGSDKKFNSYTSTIFISLFAFWRIAYNVGIGWLLDNQSKHKTLIKWAIKYDLFSKNEKGTKNWLQNFIQYDLKVKMNSNDIYEVPIEFNTWILFRHFVDLVLMSDFICYFLVVCSCFNFEGFNQPLYLIVFRLAIGILLNLFNLWVKMDAHRVVQDYAWYWGDFFFLQDINLTFDGVFEMAPHPMYSIGYAGFYGAALISSSYKVLIISVLAHICQFLFLIIVENPHIEKIYNPKPIRRLSSSIVNENENEIDIDEEKDLIKPMVIFYNFHLLRQSDILTLIVCIQTLLLIFLPQSNFFNRLLFLNAIFWKLWHFFGLGYILSKQSSSFLWTKYFLKFGYTKKQSFNQWQILYNFTIILSYSSFFIILIREIINPNDHSNLHSLDLKLSYTIGLFLISLQIWTSYSIFESLGDYGWFYGDFFHNNTNNNYNKLSYSGIHRYLNDPERWFGIAGIWGCVIICNSIKTFIIALLWTFGQIFFLQFIEQPHMKKIYGDQIRLEAGVVKSIKSLKTKRVLSFSEPFTKKVKDLQGSVDKVFNETINAVEEFINENKPKLSAAVGTVGVSQTKIKLLKEYPTRLTISISNINGNSKLDKDLDISKYKLNISTISSTPTLNFNIGDPIKLNWEADPNHSPTDWIGVYRVIDNQSNEITTVSSEGKWVPIDPDAYDEDIIPPKPPLNEKNGTVTFSSSVLPWEEGTYEFRYHHNGKHKVLAISQTFKIIIPKFKIDKSTPKETSNKLLPFIINAFDVSKDEPPKNIFEFWQLQNVEDSKVVKRLIYFIKESCGYELSKEVLYSDKNILQMSERLHKIHDVLKPFVQLEED